MTLLSPLHDHLLACLRLHIRTSHASLEITPPSSRSPHCFATIAPAQSILGFTPTSSTHESVVEDKFKSIPTPDEERRQHRIFTAEPHIAGSKRNNELAEYIRDEWKKQGLEDVVIRRYDVYGTNPKSRLARNDRAHALHRALARNSHPRRR